MKETTRQKTKRILCFILAQIAVITMYCSYSKAEDKIRSDVTYCVVDGNYYLESPNNQLVFVSSEETREMDDKIVIQDLRDQESSDIKVVNSYSINDPRQMMDIITMIQMYDQLKPDEVWYRDKYTMYLEWLAHNVLYNYDRYKKSCVDVDFREDELESLGFPVPKLIKK